MHLDISISVAGMLNLTSQLPQTSVTCEHVQCLCISGGNRPSSLDSGVVKGVLESEQESGSQHTLGDLWSNACRKFSQLRQNQLEK